MENLALNTEKFTGPLRPYPGENALKMTTVEISNTECSLLATFAGLGELVDPLTPGDRHLRKRLRSLNAKRQIQEQRLLFLEERAVQLAGRLMALDDPEAAARPAKHLEDMEAEIELLREALGI